MRTPKNITVATASHYRRLEGQKFTSFADLGRAMHRCDIERAANLTRTRAARKANAARKARS